MNDLEFYLKQIIAQRFPMENDDLTKYLHQGRIKALQVLHSQSIANAPPEKLTTMRMAFDDKFDNLSETLKSNNYLASEKACDDLFRTLHDKVSEKVSSNEYQDFKQLADDWDLMIKFYRENANGPAKHEILSKSSVSMYRADVE
jgi:hypothetical protein